MATYEEAIDLMYGTFKTAWDAGAAAIAGYVPEVQYEGVRSDKHAPNNKIWARLSVRNAIEDQSAMGTPQIGKHVYTSVGTLIIELYLPKNDNNALVVGRRLAQLVQNAYRSVSSGAEVWYREVTIREQPPEERWYRVDVNGIYTFTAIA